MKTPTTTPAQDAAVAAHYDGEPPFSVHDMMDDANRNDLLRWVADDALVGLVDESCGGIIGYVHRDHADRIAALLNASTL